MNDKTTGGEVMLMPTDDRTKIEIIPFGTDEKIQLNVAIVQKIIAVPTRSGKTPDSTQCLKFMMLCKARHLNPFEGDAYLLGYDTQSGPQFSLITAHQVFLKRAEASKGFDGMTSGVIVQDKAGKLDEREGDLVLDDEKLVGGWAKVFRKDTTHPFYRRLKLSTFSTGRSRWEKDPAGMIVKCAEADALRSAFPTHLGGLYMTEEREVIDVEQVPAIPRAAIAAAPAANGAATATAEPAVQPENPTPRAKKKLRTAKPEPEKPPVEPQAPAEPELGEHALEITKRLKEAGRSVADLLFVALLPAHGWVDAPEGYNGTRKELEKVSLASLDQEKLGIILEDWQTVVEMMEEAAKGDS